MRQIVICIAILLGLNCSTNAQEAFFKESLQGIKKVEIEASTYMTVVAGTANEVSFQWGSHCEGCKKSLFEDEDENDFLHEKEDNFFHEKDTSRKDKAKGLKAIYAGGEDNTGMGMYLERDGEVLRIKDLKPITQRKPFTITVPSTIDLHLDCGNLGSALVKGITSELEINSNVGSIQLLDVTGPITANSATGNIDVIFSSVSQNAPISISTATGDVDVSLPTNVKANVILKSTMGTVYSNFDLEKPREDGLRVVGNTRKIEGTLNNGGVKVHLSSSVGNIYLRKKE